jgi:hypothetical protein
MPDAKHIMRPTPYASCADFRQIFDEDMKSLYLLSFLLTADHEKAERCFVSGLDDAVEGNPVFIQWARSWARRAIIQNAVRVINPRPIEGSRHSNSAFGAGNGETNSNGKTLVAEQQAEIAAVLEVEPFERFVYVMTVLERYSDQDCSLLLSCSRRDVAAARTRALQQIGSATALHYQQLPNASSAKRAPHELRSSGLQLLVAQV